MIATADHNRQWPPPPGRRSAGPPLPIDETIDHNRANRTSPRQHQLITDNSYPGKPEKSDYTVPLYQFSDRAYARLNVDVYQVTGESNMVIDESLPSPPSLYSSEYVEVIN